jgi:hypothetical protein
MKVHVVYDQNGAIVALGVPLPPNYDRSHPRSGAVAGEGQQVATLEVPEELAEAPVSELGRRLVVDTSRRPHTLKKSG